MWGPLQKPHCSILISYTATYIAGLETFRDQPFKTETKTISIKIQDQDLASQNQDQDHIKFVSSAVESETSRGLHPWLDIPDTVYNWLVDYDTGHSHCTTYDGSTSSLRQISASIVQGSAIGPASYVVNAADLLAVSPGNQLCKYADDTYIHHHPSRQSTHPRY